MVSSSLAFLRSVPESQAQIANNGIATSYGIRTDAHIAGPARLKQLQMLSDMSIASLQDLLDRSNEAERVIRSALKPQAAASETSKANIRWQISELGLSLRDICQQCVESNDRDGLVALSELAPAAIRGGKLSVGQANSSVNKVIDYANEQIAVFAAQLFTDKEKALAQEVRECDISMSHLRKNHQDLVNYFESLTLANAVAGMHNRPERLFRWQGIPGDNLPKGYINLQSDVSISTPSEIGGGSGSGAAPTGGYLYNGSQAGQWTETPTRRGN